MAKRYLLDVNVLVALTDQGHEHYRIAEAWFASLNDRWGICALTEVSYIRLAANSAMQAGPRGVEQAAAILQMLKVCAGYRYWKIDDNEDWVTLTAQFAARIFGHQQVTDAYLLGLAIKENGVLVTFDRGIKYMAGAEFSRNVLVLDSSTP